jgi:diguanylate cyclase (GGDEF)-like protein
LFGDGSLQTPAHFPVLADHGDPCGADKEVVNAETVPHDEDGCDAREARAVDIECIRQVVLTSSSNLVLIFTGASALVVALFGQIHPVPAAVWLAAVVALRCIVHREATTFGERLTSSEPRGPWRHLASEWCEGMVWGSSIFMLHPREQHYEVFVLLALCTVSIIAALSMSPYFRAAMAFTVPINAIEVAYLIHDGDRWGWEGAGAVCAIFGITVLYAKIVRKTLKTAVSARRTIARLAAQLEIAKGTVEESNAALVSRNDQLREIASQDALTGLFNRRHFMEELDHVASSVGKPWFLAILDADHFKRINDEFGHGMGDEVLVSIGVAALGQLRRGDCFARIGGEEFGLLLQGITFEEAVCVVERVRAAVASIELGVGVLTLSAGLVVGESGTPAASTLGRADAALYSAKRAGRDQLVCC